MAYVEDEADYRVYIGTTILTDTWQPGFMYLNGITPQAPGTCTYDLEAIVACGVYAKLQFEFNGSGTWIDLTPYLSWEDWEDGVSFTTDFAGNYDIRLVALDIDCGAIPNSNILEYTQQDNCG